MHKIQETTLSYIIPTSNSNSQEEQSRDISSSLEKSLETSLGTFLKSLCRNILLNTFIYFQYAHNLQFTISCIEKQDEVNMFVSPGIFLFPDCQESIILIPLMFEIGYNPFQRVD